MGDVSSRRFYRGRPRTYQAPIVSETTSSSSVPKAHQKNQQRAAKRSEKRAREEDEAVSTSSGAMWLLCTGQPGSG